MTLAIKQTADLIFEFLFDLIRFPWWWYSGGLKLVALKCWRGFSATRSRVSLGIFAKYLFKPMYQDYTLQGRAISFFMRLFLLIIKSIRLVLSALWYLTLVVAWLLLFPLALVVIFY
ncbi:MAG: hypothetical protein UV57_C0017G0005 [Parcubacteria group bacterium GW2011_GWD2_43_10]|uniref:Uncharacterized protein n=5 Tax=Candidatus Vebleniibacteriota TaxID=1817921 RepID=A0A1G2Q4V0_9BACT|nr:MAG: hypothetical protein UV47_C0024G0005 [Parcubacteria group bacterium GW2011_GWA2_42_80]KKS78732.1 MAG: hypothetical protein UV52_C0028G0002 [Parcubacteria group bacterium GW2011_GWD1_42_9]KKS83328.1 MAG: hypothetical protein UV57_C0017G0005 [Parcubacteria group bacterium GW2011_GWD2_43_10]KKS92405.1 MAG: hypothetical protein UV69_C0032G0005 [Parcubacteria group bacterium GW2011_GWE2_43_12]KKT12005.1 MAG: hypothetical protein UV92_C0035G0002 [Parcubacteria group bacterium GW2011_GWA1_43_2